MQFSPDWQKPQFSCWSDWVCNYAKGFCIGAADIVPGISGGTVAFIIGMYENLIQSIATLNSANLLLLLQGKCRAFFQAVSWQFLLSCVLGVVTAFYTLAHFFTYLLNDELYRSFLYSLFFGLVLGSTILCARQLKVWRRGLLVCFFLAFTAALFLTSCDLTPRVQEPVFHVPLRAEDMPTSFHMQIGHKAPSNVDRERFLLRDVPASHLKVMVAKQWIDSDAYVLQQPDNLPVVVHTILATSSSKLVDGWVVVCGVIAISAMLLPGISGSYMLTILGMYGVVLGALLDWMDGLGHGMWNMPAFRIVFSMGIGIGIGAVLFSRMIAYLLRHWREYTFAALIGFMTGSLRAVWPFWNYSYEIVPMKLLEGVRLVPEMPFFPAHAGGDVAIAIVLCVVGVALVLSLERIAKRHSL